MSVLRRGKFYGKTPSFTGSPDELCELGRGTARGSTGSTWSGAANQRSEYASTGGNHATHGYDHTANEYNWAANTDHHQGRRPDYYGTSDTDESRYAAEYSCPGDAWQHATWNATGNTTWHTARDPAWHTGESTNACARDWMCSVGGNCERYARKYGRIDSGDAWLQRAYRLDANNAR